jgi:hypothetical protein
LDIPGLRDIAVHRYSDWQQSKIGDKTLKAEFRKAREVILAEGLNLEQVHKDQDCDFLIKKDVKRDLTRRFIRDIKDWVEHYRADYDPLG